MAHVGAAMDMLVRHRDAAAVVQCGMRFLVAEADVSANCERLSAHVHALARRGEYGPLCKAGETFLYRLSDCVASMSALQIVGVAAAVRPVLPHPSSLRKAGRPC